MQDSFAEPSAYQDGVYYGSAEGFGGAIQVEVTISGGVIQNIRIISAAYETASYLQRAQTVISSILNAGSPNVDAVSGATYSSTGIINAVKRALSQATADSTDQEEAPEPDDDIIVPDLPNTEDPEPDLSEENPYQDGVYTATGWCEDEDGTFCYELTVTVTVSDGKISAVDVEKTQDESEEPEDNDRYLSFALDGRTRKGVFYVGVPQQIINNQSADKVDAVSGATYSSETIQRAVLQALELSKSSSPDEGDGEDCDSETTSSGEPSQEPETETGPDVSEPPEVETGETEYPEEETDLSEQQESSDEPEEGKRNEAE
jgi:uncharacterized protein with FMN-binding domain